MLISLVSINIIYCLKKYFLFCERLLVHAFNHKKSKYDRLKCALRREFKVIQRPHRTTACIVIFHNRGNLSSFTCTNVMPVATSIYVVKPPGTNLKQRFC